MFRLADMENKDLPVATWADVREGAVLMYVPSRAELKVTAATADRIEGVVTVSTQRWEPVGSQWRGGKQFVDSGAYRLVSPAPSATPARLVIGSKMRFNDITVGMLLRWGSGGDVRVTRLTGDDTWRGTIEVSRAEMWKVGKEASVNRHECHRGLWFLLEDAPAKAADYQVATTNLVPAPLPDPVPMAWRNKPAKAEPVRERDRIVRSAIAAQLTQTPPSDAITRAAEQLKNKASYAEMERWTGAQAAFARAYLGSNPHGFKPTYREAIIASPATGPISFSEPSDKPATSDAAIAALMDTDNDAYARRQRQDVRNILAGWARADMNASQASMWRTSRK